MIDQFNNKYDTKLQMVHHNLPSTLTSIVLPQTNVLTLPIILVLTVSIDLM